MDRWLNEGTLKKKNSSISAPIAEKTAEDISEEQQPTTSTKNMSSDRIVPNIADLNVSTTKIARKTNFRKTIDYNSSILLFNEKRITKRKFSKRDIIQPDVAFKHLLTPSVDFKDKPLDCICLKHVRTSINKFKFPIYTVCWTPDGRRLISGSASGEFTIWNGLTFNFETITHGHDDKIRAMKWSNNEEWMISADDSGVVKYWQANLNDVKVFQAHKEPIKALDFGPSDKKFVTCGSDNTLRVWDFFTSEEERVLRGHGSEVTSVGWHTTKSLLISGSRDCQQPVKLWDPRSGACFRTLYCHKSVCLAVKLNKNGNWFLTASKDKTIKLFDIRNLSKELQLFRGNTKDVNEVAWHPIHESFFVSGSADGVLKYWSVGIEEAVGSVNEAHESGIWSLDWHPLGHLLASGSNDFSTRFWTRNVTGDIFEDDKVLNQTDVDKDVKPEKIMKMSNFDNVLNSDINELETSITSNLNEIDEILQENSTGIEKNLKTYQIPKQLELNWANKLSRPIALSTIAMPNITQTNKHTHQNCSLNQTAIMPNVPHQIRANFYNQYTNPSNVPTNTNIPNYFPISQHQMIYFNPNQPIINNNVHQNTNFTQTNFFNLGMAPPSNTINHRPFNGHPKQH